MVIAGIRILSWRPMVHHVKHCPSASANGHWRPPAAAGPPLIGTPLATSAGLELTIDDAALFKDLNAVIKCFDTAIKKSRSRVRKSAGAEADDDDVEDDIEDS
ncbi:hypothetical protein B0H11DRAFT_2200881 [Mycena galericulata]|nr:hypothetical protein B0H11DRAFT_2200881 [Mycena galericulata]